MRKEVALRLLSLTILALAVSQPACIVAGGYSSDRGLYVWPGSLISVAVVVVLFLLLRRRRR